jgi:hypothetical protein
LLNDASRLVLINRARKSTSAHVSELLSQHAKLGILEGGIAELESLG